jgi:hypothetical protein
MTPALQARGFSPADAARKAYGLLQGSLFQQSRMLAYIGNFWLLGASQPGDDPAGVSDEETTGGGMVAHW